ncbi:MAG TPA: quinate 5-dehydrogenase [Candidatus Avacidaminococcus intestinavium]|uniref:Quinate 5-dehydrogenase n=1 Tax=Candidatus Avacidaminococcus intestinavium TaxID=2840684 RepID=A0A9D1MPC0_9FIRM|nr:quinate 5-dehydrogenase [Candidatus Avacidaminococcus intestinavium]
MKQVVSISLGSSERDSVVYENFAGERVRIERRGTDGDKAKAKALLLEHDGAVDALGLGGTDLYIFAGGRRYTFAESARLIKNLQQTPVLDGSGLKNTLERYVIEEIDRLKIIDFKDKKVLLVCGVDRFGLGEALSAAGAEVTFGDLLYGLGVPLPIRSLAQLSTLAKIVAPVVTKMPVSWFYPVGQAQTKKQVLYPEYFYDSDIIVGDFHFIKKFMPKTLPDKIIITNTVTQKDRELLKAAGIKLLITTTPNFKGRSFGTNVLEAVLVALQGQKHALNENEYRAAIKKYGIEPALDYLA